MKQNVIYSENPTKDIWARLLSYCHDRNLSQISSLHQVTLGSAEKKEITAALKHSSEYFHAAAEAGPNTAPVHIYYGMVSLLRAVSIIKTGNGAVIKKHGMTMPDVGGSSIGDLLLKTQGAKNGSLVVYADALDPHHGFTGATDWTLEEILGAIPDCYNEYCSLYGSSVMRYCIPIERVIVPEGYVIDRINLEGYRDAKEALYNIAKLEERYLTPVLSSNYIVLRPRLIGGKDISVLSLSGQRFLARAYDRSVSGRVDQIKVLLPSWMAMFMGMFVLCTLSRYHPVAWTELSSSSQEESVLIERFVNVSIRVFPNIALDLVLGTPNVFTANRAVDTDLRKFANHADVSKMVEEKAREILAEMVQRGIS